MYHLTTKCLAMLVIGSAVMAGCDKAYLREPSSPYSRVIVDSRLEINQTIVIPPGATRVFLQLGKVSNSFNHYATNCNIEVAKIDRDKPQTVEPGVYRIYRVQPMTEEVVQALPVLVAAAVATMIADGVDNGGASFIYKGYHLWLDGPDPNVRRLTCRGSYADPAHALPPGIDEIRQALGGVATLLPAAS